MKHIIYNITILSILTLISCGDKEVKNKQAEMQNSISDNRIFVSKAQFKHSNMTLGSITEHPFPVTVKTNGIIDVPPENRAVVNAIIGGNIKTTPLLIGDKVRKGEALVTIENPEFVRMQQEYMEVNARLSYLKSELERQQTIDTCLKQRMLHI